MTCGCTQRNNAVTDTIRVNFDAIRRALAGEENPDAHTAEAEESSLAPSEKPSTHSLVCVLALGNELTSLPKHARAIDLPAETQLVVGRENHMQMLESLLANEPGKQYLGCVSRSHIEVRPVDLQTSRCFEVANLSINPIMLGDLRLDQGGKGIARLGDCIDFIAAGTEGSANLVYLSFCLEAAGQDAASRAEEVEALQERRVEALGRAMERKLGSFMASTGFKAVNEQKTAAGGISRRFAYPLHAAVKRNDPGAVEALLWAGADAALVDSNKHTPLAFARRLDRKGSHKKVIIALST